MYQNNTHISRNSWTLKVHTQDDEPCMIFVNHRIIISNESSSKHASLLTDVLPRHVPNGVKRIDTCAAAVPHIARRGTAIGNNQYSTSFGKEILLYDDCCTQSKTETWFHVAEMRVPVMASVSPDFDDQTRSLSARVFLYNSSLSIDKHHSLRTPYFSTRSLSQFCLAHCSLHLLICTEFLPAIIFSKGGKDRFLEARVGGSSFHSSTHFIFSFPWASRLKMAAVNALAVQVSFVVAGSSPATMSSNSSSRAARLSSSTSCTLGGLRLNVSHNASSTSNVIRSTNVRPLTVRAEESVTDSIKKASESAADKVKDTASAAKDKVQGAATDVGNFVSGQSEEAKDAADSVSGDVQRKAERFGNQAENKSRNFERDAQGTASDARDEADNLAVSTTTSTFPFQFTQYCKLLFSSGQSWCSYRWEPHTHILSISAIWWIDSSISTVLKAVLFQLNCHWNYFCFFFRQGKARNAIGDAGDAIKRNFDKASGSVENAGKNVKAETQRAGDEAKRGAEDVKGDAKRTADRISN